MNPESVSPSTEPRTNEAWLVIAIHQPSGREFPTYTVMGCGNGWDAIYTVLEMGFAFGGRGSQFILRAERVAVFDFPPQRHLPEQV
jgi:hypothetical protein